MLRNYVIIALFCHNCHHIAVRLSSSCTTQRHQKTSLSLVYQQRLVKLTADVLPAISNRPCEGEVGVRLYQVFSNTLQTWHFKQSAISQLPLKSDH